MDVQFDKTTKIIMYTGTAICALGVAAFIYGNNPVEIQQQPVIQPVVQSGGGKSKSKSKSKTKKYYKK